MLHEPLYFYETTNQSSYVHNLSRIAIESQYRADGSLMAFFANKQEYADIITVLPQRSMTSLIKNTDAKGWAIVVDVYSECLTHPGKGLTLVNRIIYHLAKNRNWSLLRLFMGVYHCVMRDRK